MINRKEQIALVQFLSGGSLNGLSEGILYEKVVALLGKPDKEYSPYSNGTTEIEILSRSGEQLEISERVTVKRSDTPNVLTTHYGDLRILFFEGTLHSVIIDFEIDKRPKLPSILNAEWCTTVWKWNYQRFSTFLDRESIIWKRAEFLLGEYSDIPNPFVIVVSNTCIAIRFDGNRPHRLVSISYPERFPATVWQLK